MATTWTVKRRYPTYLLSADKKAAEPRTGWDLKCPKGHEKSMTTNFTTLDESISIGCEACNAPYSVKLVKP